MSLFDRLVWQAMQAKPELTAVKAVMQKGAVLYWFAGGGGGEHRVDRAAGGGRGPRFQ